MNDSQTSNMLTDLWNRVSKLENIVAMHECHLRRYLCSCYNVSPAPERCACRCHSELSGGTCTKCQIKQCQPEQENCICSNPFGDNHASYCDAVEEKIQRFVFLEDEKDKSFTEKYLRQLVKMVREGK